MKAADNKNQKPRRVLIVEDSPPQALVLQNLLKKNDFTVSVAVNGTEALASLGAQPADLVISDVDMPGMNGYELSLAIKSDPKLAAIPVILLTTLSATEHILSGLKARADYYLTKPYNARYLMARIQTLLQQPLPRPGASSAPDEALEITLDGKRHVVTADRRQILNLLLSTSESAIQQNRELTKAQLELNEHNRQLREQSKHLQATERNFRALLEHTVDGMAVVDRGGLVRFVNTNGQLLLRESSADLLGKAFEFPVAADESREVNIKRPDWEPIVAELRAVDTIWEGEAAFLVSLRDITQRKRDEQRIKDQQTEVENANAELNKRNRQLRDQSKQLQLSERNFRVLLEQNVDGMIVVDRRGLVRFVNTTGQILLRQSSAEVIGKPFEFPVAAEATSEVNIKRPEWEPIIAELRAADAVWEGESALVISLRDITQRKRDEQKIREQQHKLELANAQLEALATQDGLTGLQNHRAFKERLEEECQRAVRYRLPLSLILLDVDHFKQYNDAFGHPAGDEVLKTVARLVREQARETDFVARYGGEEFAALLPNTGLRDAVGLAEKMRESIARSASARRTTTASFGIASMKESPCTAADFLSAADHALYASKQQGRNRVTTAAALGVTKNAA